MIIDCYTQLGPGLANHADQVIRPIDDTATAAGLIATMDRAGVDRAVTFAPRWVGGPFMDPTYERANRAVADAVRAHPDRLIGYARVNPNYGEQAVRELETCLREYGFRGLMLDPEWENFHPSSRTLAYPLYETARSRHAPVLFHSWYAPSEPALYWQVATDFPELPVVIGHLGGRLTADAALVAQRAPNVYLETSDHFLRLGATAQRIGADRVLFGSNTPFSVAEAELYKITDEKTLTADERAMILGENAARLHGL